MSMLPSLKSGFQAGPQNILAKCSGVVRGTGGGGRLLVDNKTSNDPHQE